MSTDKSNIDNLFNKKLSGCSIEPPSDEWFEIDMNLTKKNFMRFSFFHFNIYYVAVFLLSTLFSVIAGIHYFIGNTENKLSAGKINNQTRGIINQENASHDSAEIIIPVATENQITQDKQKLIQKIDILPNKQNKKFNNQEIINNTNNQDIDKKNIKDTLFVNQKTIKDKKVVTDTDQQKEKQKIKDTIYIRKQDVIIRDTIIQYKKGRKRKNKD